MKANITIREILRKKSPAKLNICGVTINPYFATPFGGGTPRYEFGVVTGKLLGWFLFTSDHLFLVAECEINVTEACSQFIAYNKLFRNLANLKNAIGSDISINVLKSNDIDENFSKLVAEKELISASSRMLPDGVLEKMLKDCITTLYNIGQPVSENAMAIVEIDQLTTVLHSLTCVYDEAVGMSVRSESVTGPTHPLIMKVKASKGRNGDHHKVIIRLYANNVQNNIVYSSGVPAEKSEIMHMLDDYYDNDLSKNQQENATEQPTVGEDSENVEQTLIEDVDNG